MIPTNKCLKTESGCDYRIDLGNGDIRCSYNDECKDKIINENRRNNANAFFTFNNKLS